MAVSFTLNGKPTTVDTADDRRLLWVLRDDLGMTGTRFGCGVAQCGCCTVLVDGKATRACITPMRTVANKSVTTIEGLASGDNLKPIQQAFLDHAGYQCGYCTSGMIMTAQGLLNGNPKPTRDQIIAGMDRNLCRCGAHPRIVDAIEAASKATAGGDA